jgi:multidrug efflux system membrane fusion protein
VRSAALNLEFATIRAPISGRAGQLLAHRGDLVTANVTDLVQINQVAPINVRFSVPEKDLASVRTAFAAGDVPVSAVPSSGGDQPSDGKLSFIDNSVDERTGSLVLKAEFPNTDERLWPGQFVQVSATLGMETGAVVVPSHAVQTGQAGSFVFVIDDQGAARLRLVKSGRLSGDDIVISDGVKAGEAVVVDGQLKLADGTPTKLKSAADDGKAKE